MYLHLVRLNPTKFGKSRIKSLSNYEEITDSMVNPNAVQLTHMDIWSSFYLWPLLSSLASFEQF